MDRRSIVGLVCLHLKGLWAHAIHDALVTTLGSKAVASITVTRYLREARLGTAKATLDRESNSPHIDDSDNTHPHTRTAAESQKLMKENELERAIHPPYSQDLAPSDFNLFSHVKHCLRGQSFEIAV
jgi:hypothetical protein